MGGERMTDKMRDFVKGLIPGLVGAPLPYTGSEPVAYLYNGVRLPQLPEWDTEAYPYAVIFKIGDEPDTFSYCVIADSAPIVATDIGNPKRKYTYKRFRYDLETGATWIAESSLSNITMGRIIWANEDVAYENGNIYMTKSEPEPVYTAAPKPQFMSFNGLRLPALPNLDTETYPYIVIGRESTGPDNQYRLEMGVTKAYMPNVQILYWNEPGDHVTTYAYTDGVGWARLHKYSSELKLTSITEIAWANFDVLNEDGSLHLAASEPVPID